MPRVQAQDAEFRARQLGASLPPMVVKAERIAATVMLGSHGLRRAGAGESFWAYRNYAFGDSTQRIDWRQSAKGDETFIRENEWEAANTLWLWANLGPRMNFKSHLAAETKREQAQVLALAMAALSLRAHERVGLLGTGERASYGRHMLSKLALRFAQSEADQLPQASALQRRSTALLVSDFLEEPAIIEKALTALAASGMRGHLLQINDPAEETLPYEGRTDFIGLDVPLRFKATRVQGIRAAYAAAFAAQREALRAIARRLGWSFSLHHTDKPLAATVLALYQRMGPA
jgi:uncharacterized protein (DUF58 family)